MQTQWSFPVFYDSSAKRPSNSLQLFVDTLVICLYLFAHDWAYPLIVIELPERYNVLFALSTMGSFRVYCLCRTIRRRVMACKRRLIDFARWCISVNEPRHWLQHGIIFRSFHYLETIITHCRSSKRTLRYRFQEVNCLLQQVKIIITVCK